MHPVRQNRAAATARPRMKNKLTLYNVGMVELLLVVVLYIVVILMPASGLIPVIPFVIFTELYYALLPLIAACFGIAARSNPSRFIFLTNLGFSSVSLAMMLLRAIAVSYNAYQSSIAYRLGVPTPYIWLIIMAIDTSVLVICLIIHVKHSGAGLSCCTNEGDEEVQYEQQTIPVNAAYVHPHSRNILVNPHATAHEMNRISMPPLNPNQSNVAPHSADMSPSQQEDCSSAVIANPKTSNLSLPDNGDKPASAISK